MRALLGTLLLALALYLLLIAAAWGWQERLVWQPPRALPPATSAQRLDYRADDGQPLYAYLVGDPSRAPGTLVAFHGNAELATWNVDWAAEVERRTGWAVLLPEYRGYGGLGGSPTYAGSGRDAEAAYRLVRDRLGTRSTRIAYHGHSLGSAVAAELAARHPPVALLLVSPFTSARDMAGEMRIPPLAALWPLIGRVAFDTRARVGALDVPVWVAHGARDGVIPAAMGHAVHAAARVKGDLLIIPGAGHNDVLVVAADDYWAWVRRALAR